MLHIKNEDISPPGFMSITSYNSLFCETMDCSMSIKREDDTYGLTMSHCIHYEHGNVSIIESHTILSDIQT